MSEFEYLGTNDAKRLREMVDNNDHMSAWALAAELCDHHRACRVFTALEDLRHCEGEVTHEAYLICARWRGYLKTWIANGHAGPIGREVLKCL